MFVLILIVTLIFFILMRNLKKLLENLASKNEKIPRILIQTWKTTNLPEKCKDFVADLKNLHPDYKYLFFTDDDIHNFLNKNYEEYLKTYEKLPLKIQKIDFFRYIAVYHYGGIYLDLDMKCKKNMNSMLKSNVVFPIDEHINKISGKKPRYSYFHNKNQHFLVGQYAFAAEPKNKFIKSLIDGIHKNINRIIRNVNHNDDNYVYVTTGPDYVTKKYMEYKEKSDVEILNNEKRQQFGDYAEHKYFGSWKKSKQ